MVKDIKIKDFDYPLPDERIARFPLAQRDACRLIVSDSDGRISHHRFSDLPSLLGRDTLMVCNETRVINARMEFHKPTGARIEIFLLEPALPTDYAQAFAATDRCVWHCLVGNRKKWKEGALTATFTLGDGPEQTTVTVEARIANDADLANRATDTSIPVEFCWSTSPLSVLRSPLSFAAVVEALGRIPIPPYLKRDSMESDSEDYQTVFSRVSGSVAAPTAGLHFTPALLERLRVKGVEMERLTLHVGAGTFKPVKSEYIGEHPMHTETFTVTRSLLKALIAALEHVATVLAIGTTSVRTLESLPYLGRLLSLGREPHIPQWLAYEPDWQDFDTVAALRELLGYMERHELDSLTASTAIMIAPGFRWRIVGRMVTNFHQPQSTLLLLVSSFLESREQRAESGEASSTTSQWRHIYDEALAGDYRFLSYGDACLLSPVKR